jgi:hypothetical protein
MSIFFILFIQINAPVIGKALNLRAGHLTIRSMVSDKDNNLWIGTFGAGLWLYKNNELQRFSDKQTDQPFPMISNLKIYNGNLWIATAGGGCVCLKLPEKRFIAVKQHKDFLKLHGLFMTSNNDLLIGSVGSGSAFLDKTSTPPAWLPVKKRFYTHLGWVNCIDEWQNKIWLGTHTGLYSTANKNLVKNWEPKSAGIYEGVNFIFPTPELLYIATTSSGVYVMKPGKQPGPVRDTYGAIHFITRFNDRLIAGGEYGLWEIKQGKGFKIGHYKGGCAKSSLITQKNTQKMLLIGTLDGRITITENLTDFNLLLDLREYSSEETTDAN